MTTTLTQSLRSDASDNRDRILRVARQLFAESGLSVTMREVARQAEVGPATLYRRFPTKHDLAVAAFVNEMSACHGIVRDAAADPDPWRGFRSVIERIIALNAKNQGFTDAFLSTYPEAVDFAAHRAELLDELAGMLKRAKSRGDLREDFTLADVVLLLSAGRGLVGKTSAKREAAARRLATLLLEGVRP
ncbi:TetR/AcrR family transcriptional regulator [Aeromicrobium panaciterrae]|uniref:TetR/AcrR family transcriptional regulator n=1 Tax=Aeromicrobium panaciterrae TaxID=363861 RepID=UPI0031D033EB